MTHPIVGIVLTPSNAVFDEACRALGIDPSWVRLHLKVLHGNSHYAGFERELPVGAVSSFRFNENSHMVGYLQERHGGIKTLQHVLGLVPPVYTPSLASPPLRSVQATVILEDGRERTFATELMAGGTIECRRAGALVLHLERREAELLRDLLATVLR